MRVDEDETRNEIIDGQQRIVTVQKFFKNELSLPKSLNDFHDDLGGKTYGDLPASIRKFVDKKLSFDIDRVQGIEDPNDREHQRIATEIFWRLQQGESLNYMEIAHSRLSSLSRNFIVKYSDDITFDYSSYHPVDNNRDKHPFFTLIQRNNDRMQDLGLMARFLLIELSDGPTDIRQSDVTDLIDKHQTKDGIGNYSFEQEKEAKSVLRNLNIFYEIFKSDPMIDEDSGVKELDTEYFIISIYLLLRHLKKYYAFSEDKLHCSTTSWTVL